MKRLLTVAFLITLLPISVFASTISFTEDFSSDEMFTDRGWVVTTTNVQSYDYDFTYKSGSYTIRDITVGADDPDAFLFLTKSFAPIDGDFSIDFTLSWDCLGGSSMNEPINGLALMLYAENSDAYSIFTGYGDSWRQRSGEINVQGPAIGEAIHTGYDSMAFADTAFIHVERTGDQLTVEIESGSYTISQTVTDTEDFDRISLRFRSHDNEEIYAYGNLTAESLSFEGVTSISAIPEPLSFVFLVIGILGIIHKKRNI